jgi:2-polyprenyl-3-methyl-5-hydroxy-6-metoxy-1,4-benzoquinol methylase
MFVGNPSHALNEYYSDEFARRDPEFYVRVQRENARINLRRILRFFELRGLTTPGLAALDVGSGFGFLVAGLNRVGFNACGLEPSRFETEYARTMVGIAVCHGFLENFVGVPFDLVVTCDVIEHVTDPAQFVRDCKSLLKPGGMLAVKTDNFGGLVADLMGLHFYRQIPLEHVSMFTPATLARLAARCGLREEASVSWTPGYSLRWALKYKLQKAFNREPALLDPHAKSIPGPSMSILGRLSNPIFAGLSPVIGASKRGIEFMSFFKSADTAGNGSTAKR